MNDVIFLLEGIGGIPRTNKSATVVELGRMPIDHFRFGEVQFTPKQLTETITRMVEGQNKTVVLKAMPNFNSNKYVKYSEAYNAIAARIKPAGGGPSLLTQQTPAKPAPAAARA